MKYFYLLHFYGIATCIVVFQLTYDFDHNSVFFISLYIVGKKKRRGEKTWHMVSEKLAGLLGGDGPMCNRKHFEMIDWKMI